MAMGRCPECTASVSTTATACPHCGNTKFLVPTGKLITQTCNRCGGRKILFREPPYSPSAGSTYNCDRCHGIGQQQLAELKDLRDGSFHVPPFPR